MSLHEDRLRRLTRLFLIYHLLEIGGSEGRLSRSDMQAACGCSLKTVQRDLTFLDEAGAKFHYDAKRRSYVLVQPLPLLSVDLQLSDLLALAMVQQTAVGQAGMPYAPQAQQAFNKLIAKLPVRLRDELSAVREAVDVVGNTRRDYSGAPLEDLVKARRQNETVEMVYYSIGRDAVSTRQVDPYSLTLRSGYLNLVGYCHQRRQVLLFALDGIRDLRLTGNRFTMPADFSLAKYMEGVVGGLRGELTEIVVRFDSSVARWARKLRWEFPHTVEQEADGALLLRGQVSGLEAIRKELLRWGAQVEALEPPALRQTMLSEAQSIVAKYRRKKEEK